MGYFFTNRPLIISDEGVVDFRNRWTRQTGNLHFCLYDYDSDSILLKYRAANDFSIFQHMLESFQADSTFFEGI
ncbi:MAG: hypothetical protein K8R52_00665 [Bacteroidales bacterium]|nr:hypothetical protein [Bacteroidales bacterium]